MADEKKGRRDIDWEKIEADFRAGLKSTNFIAKEHGITEAAIRKKAKAGDWQRDITDKVRTAVRTKLVRSEVRTDPPCPEKAKADEAAIIDATAAIGAEVIRSHRKGIAKLRSISEKLADRLERILSGEDPKEVGICLGSSETPTQMLNRLTSTMDSLIKLERVAFNLDEDDGSQDKGPKVVYVDGFDAAA